MASSTIAPRTIKALAAYEQGLEVKPFEYTSRALGVDDVEIAISHCAICASDVHTLTGRRNGVIFPVVPGHEIVGTVTATGEEVSELCVGDRVGVGAMVLSCMDAATCEDCASDNEPLCSKVVLTYRTQYPDGARTFGGYADYIRVSSKWAFKIPDEIPSDFAAPLLCAGVTVYKPLKKFVRPGHRVGVVGIGGLGHIALLFTKALDATPVAFSHSPNKEQAARELGAEDFVLITKPEDLQKAARSVDVLLVTADAPNQPYDDYIKCIKKGGKLVMVGTPSDKMQISALQLLISKVSVVGSAIGGIKDTKEMLALAAKRGVRPVIQKRPMHEASAALALVDQGQARYRIVLEN